MLPAAAANRLRQVMPDASLKRAGKQPLVLPLMTCAEPNQV